MKKSQVGIELVTLVGVLVFIFILMQVFIFNKNSELIQTEKYLDRVNNCLKISNIISEVYVNGHGTFALIETKYNLTVSDWLLIDDDGVGCRVNADVSSSDINGNVRISNVNGVVFIENV